MILQRYCLFSLVQLLKVCDPLYFLIKLRHVLALTVLYLDTGEMNQCWKQGPVQPFRLLLWTCYQAEVMIRTWLD